MTWYHQLGFNKNPLDYRPNINLIGLKDEELQIINHVKKEEICFINGLTGSGKTSMLKRIQKKLAKEYKFMYLDAHDLPLDFDLEKELSKKRSFFDMLALRKYPKQKPVLIIDEFQSTDPDLVLKVRSKWEDPDKRKIRSIIIAQISKKLNNVSDSFKERIGSRVVNLRPLKDEELVVLLNMRLNNKRKRINYAKQLSSEAVEMLVNTSGGNPRRLLEYADLIFDYHYNKFKKLNPLRNKDYSINQHLTKQILEENGVLIKNIEQSEFEKVFSVFERHIIEFLAEKERTKEEVTEQLKLSSKAVSKALSKLEEDDYITPRTINGNTFYTITQRTNRLMVNE